MLKAREGPAMARVNLSLAGAVQDGLKQRMRQRFK
jgi:hypothetical protein